jgi:hypothetical protein
MKVNNPYKIQFILTGSDTIHEDIVWSHSIRGVCAQVLAGAGPGRVQFVNIQLAPELLYAEEN